MYLDLVCNTKIDSLWVNSIAALSGDALRKENEARNSVFYLYSWHILLRHCKYLIESAFKFHNSIRYSPDHVIVGNWYQTRKDGKLSQFKRAWGELLQEEQQHCLMAYCYLAAVLVQDVWSPAALLLPLTTSPLGGTVFRHADLAVLFFQFSLSQGF